MDSNCGIKVESVLSRPIPDEAIYYVEDMDCFAAVFCRGGQDDMEHFFVIHINGDWQEHDVCSCRLHLLEDMKRINHFNNLHKENAKLREELDAVQKANSLVCQEASNQKARADKTEAEKDALLDALKQITSLEGDEIWNKVHGMVDLSTYINPLALEQLHKELEK